MQNLKGPLKSCELVCLDCETTGLDLEKDRIIEVAVAVFKDGKIIDSFESLVNPMMPIPEESRKIHGIKNEMLEHKPQIGALLPQIMKMVGFRPIVGHGINFDIQMIESECKRENELFLLKSNLQIDTLRMARAYGESPVNSLERLREHFNIPDEVAHRAMSDVIVNIAVFEKLASNYKSIHEIVEKLKTPIEMKVMPLGPHKGRALKEIPLQYLKWAVRKNFDIDLLFSIRQEIKKRERGESFNQASNPFRHL